MLKFVIVDDEVESINHIKKLIGEVVYEEFECVCFTKVCEELKSEIKNLNERKIYIMDIELGSNMSGISIAKLIRDVDWESDIIFITNHDKMFEIVHRSVYSVFDFIEKFHDFDKRFKKDIKEITKRKFDKKMFNYSVNGVSLSIYYKSILFIYKETGDRKLIIVTETNDYKVNMSMKELMTLLDERFWQCHKSCIVNEDRVVEKNFKEGYFVMDNGRKEYLLSRRYKKANLYV